MLNINALLLNLGRYHALVQRTRTKKLSFLQIRRKFYADYWSDAAKKVGADIRDVGSDYFLISKNNRSVLVQFHQVSIDTYLNLKLVTSKTMIQKILAKGGYPIPRFKIFDISSLNKARDWMAEQQGSFVIKPSRGSGGRGITTGITNDKRLKKATVAAAASLKKESLIIEQQVKGDSYRLLYLNGKLIDVIQRCRPTVVGNGKSSIRELIADENRQRHETGTSRSFNPLTVDLDCLFYLEDHHMNLNTVPKQGEKAMVKNVANENAQRDNFSVRARAHPYYQELGKKISESLSLNLIGIDIMAEDVAAPLDTQGGVINEINIPPGLHYHELIDNQQDKADIGQQVLEFIFTKSAIDPTIPSDLCPF